MIIVAKHRGIWPAGWLCGALGVSRGGFYAWLTRAPSRRSRRDEELAGRVRTSFLQSDRTYGARRVWRDGPVVPVSADFPNPPQRSRYLVTGKTFDDTAVSRLSKDFVITGLRFVNAAIAEPLKINLIDPSGTVVGALAWSPGQLGSQAEAQVSPPALIMLPLVAITMVLLIVYALRGWKKVEKGKFKLNTALENMAHGLCMFDADHRLITFNSGFAKIFNTTPAPVGIGQCAAAS